MLNDGGGIYYIFTFLFIFTEKAIAVWNIGIFYTAKREFATGH